MEPNLLSIPLVLFLKEHPAREHFPDQGVNYFERFVRVNDWLNANIHPHVNQGATAARDESDPDAPPIWLTDHGVEHIQTVIMRASKLACEPHHHLTPYESYLLLLAIHFHDVGNIFGRQGHERRITEVMTQIDKELLGSDNTERRLIRDIAMAHGGRVGDDKDTIRYLRYEEHPKHGEPRAHLLAAVLRLADELAEDHTRTKRFLIDNKLVAGSEIFHVYADRLRRVDIAPLERAVKVHFEINADSVDRTYRKLAAEANLVDEIQARLLKIHSEMVYCSRYMRPYIHFDTLVASFECCSADYMTVLGSRSFKIREIGYPGAGQSLADVCPDMAGRTLRNCVDELLGITNDL